MKKTTVSVSERALLQRVNRALVHQGRRVYRCKETSSSYDQLGDYYVVLTDNGVGEMHVNLEAKAKELGVLKEWERLEK